MYTLYTSRVITLYIPLVQKVNAVFLFSYYERHGPRRCVTEMTQIVGTEISQHKPVELSSNRHIMPYLDGWNMFTLYVTSVYEYFHEKNPLYRINMAIWNFTRNHRDRGVCRVLASNIGKMLCKKIFLRPFMILLRWRLRLWTEIY